MVPVEDLRRKEAKRATRKQLASGKLRQEWLQMSRTTIEPVPALDSHSNRLLAPLFLLLLLTPSLLVLAAPSVSGNNLEVASAPPAHSNFLQIPGLYQQDQLITPIQGQSQFERLVLHINKADEDESSLATNNSTKNDLSQQSSADDQKTVHDEIKNQTISLVQFYMATCPDCQGFSPYFRRFVSDIGAHWRHLIRIFVVNCNDDLNINLCWQQNPTLVVPLVRWYTYPMLLRQSLVGKDHPDKYLTSVAHRSYIEKQRRDLISLRHATLRFITTVIDQLDEYSNNSTDTTSFYKSLPIRARLLQPVGQRLVKLNTSSDDTAEARDARFLADISARASDCLQKISMDIKPSVVVQHFLIFEARKSFVGKTVAADWSNWTCSQDFPLRSIGSKSQLVFMIHHTSDLDLLGRISPAHRFVKQADVPFLFAIDKYHPDGPIENSAEVLQSLELRLLGSAESALATKSISGLIMRRRRRNTEPPPRSISQRTQRLIDAENINWAPNELYPGEELYRRHFNLLVGTRLAQLAGVNASGSWMWKPASDDTAFGEIHKTKKVDPNAVVSPRDEDLSLVRLTDYYKVLAEMVHKNILSKAQVDGYQLLATTCLLRQLAQHFPFQGGARGGSRSSQSLGRKSLARNYVELLQRDYADLISQRLNGTNLIDCSGGLSEATNKRVASMEPVSSLHLEKIQLELQKKHDIGLPAGEHFKWSYCAGSSPYLRGHTCSLWLLFHTLTVHEYLTSQNGEKNPYATPAAPTNNTTKPDIEYRFVVKYSTPGNLTIPKQQSTTCDPKNPEPALLNSTSSQLFVNRPQYALANIINFVRFYLSCTNCAAHFSCMVQNSELDFENPRPADHLLWLWEAHNRVNLRTRSTHSEDPIHPKHVFPVYDACPTCYLERPSDNSSDFEQMRFNRTELVNFLVSRYRRSAILNNKIRIEDFYKKPIPTALPK